MAITTSPAAHGEQRKFINPTPGFVGANVFDPEGKPTAIAVEPGGEVWLTAAEERMTAEAPRLAQHNPFIMEWEEAVEWTSDGEVSRTVTRQGVLVLSEEAPRPVASDRFIPGRASTEPAPEPETVKGADVPEQPPVEGQPSENEIVATPEAPAANEEALAKRQPTAEQPTRKTARPLPIDD